MNLSNKYFRNNKDRILRLVFSCTLILCVFGNSLNLSSQEKYATIKLEKKIGLNNNVSFTLNALREVPDYDVFEISDADESYIIGSLKINYLQDLYDARLESDSAMKKYLDKVEKLNLDTMQFINNKVITNNIYAYVSLNNTLKTVIIDTDFDSSFVDEEIFTYDLNNGCAEGADYFKKFYRDMKLKIDSSSSIITSPIRIGVLTNYIDKDYRIGGNDSLQIYISPDFYYSGVLIDKKDTLAINVETQYFDQFYINENLCGKYSYSFLNKVEVESPYNYKKKLYFKNYIYSTSTFNPLRKEITLKYEGYDSIGANPGNYFKETPGLDSIDNYSLIFFTGSWCKPCKTVLDSLISLHKLKPEIDIYNVNYEVDTLEFQKYIQKYDITWNVILDLVAKKNQWKSSLYRDAYQINGYPVLFLLNPNRRILRKADGMGPCVDLIEELKRTSPSEFEF